MMEQVRIEGCVPPKRPDFKAVYDAFIAKCAEILAGEDINGDKTESLKNIFQHESDVYTDEFQLAKDFEREGWAVNKEFLETIESMCDAYREIKNDAIKLWVREWNIKPKIAEGTEVFWNGNEYNVKYDKYYLEYAQYLLPVKDSFTKKAYIVNFEDLEKANEN